MKKIALAFLCLAPMLLISCGEDSGSSSSGSSATSGSVNPNENTVASVLSSFGAKNMKVVDSFTFISGSPCIVAQYVEEGCYFTFDNFPNASDYGYVSKEGKTYAWTEGKGDDGKATLVQGDELKKNGASVSSFRDVYYDPSYLAENVAAYTAENAFTPKIAGTTNGTFNLYAEVKDGDAVVKDNRAILENLSKALGVYDTAASFSSSLTLNAADLYFSATGSTFTFNFYYTYDGGYDRLIATSIVNKVGSTKISLIEGFLK